MTKSILRKILLLTLLIYAVFTVSFYFLAGDQLKYRDSKDNIMLPEADSITPEIVKGVIVKQDFLNNVDSIKEMSFVFTKQYRAARGKVYIDLLDGTKIIGRKELDANSIPEQHRVYMNFLNPLEGYEGKTLTVKVYSNCEENDGVYLMMKSHVSDDSEITVGKRTIDGTICFSLAGEDVIAASAYYWAIVGFGGLLLAEYFVYSYRRFCSGKSTLIVLGILAIFRYKFLISQLVSRDFKTKYKRSILGVFWSFLNPLLTMTVQFLVFSTIFKADSKSYPVYLLSGVICFNFFKEASDMCLTSISGNANLIKKVYIPKYILPLARTISSSINLAIALVPLFLVTLIQRITIKPAALLMFYFLGCLILFTLGVGMFLAALMVFFRDIQFLWSVISQIWLYATPIFYTAEIIPDKYSFVIKLNPLYHFIGNIRKCLMDGISPEPMAYIYCLAFAVLAFAVGAYTFKKTQDNFTLYL